MALGLSGCTGGQRSEAGEVPRIRAATASAASIPQPKQPSVRESLDTIDPAIPVYAGAEFRADLTLHDAAGIRDQFGAPAEVYTLTSTDPFPMVWHYYVTYLGQYRGFEPPKPYPPANQQWRTMQINLASAMQDPFIPEEGRRLGRNVLLQISEIESGQATVIRYVITPRAVDAPQVVVQ
ncbi:MAG: hypothetical protein ACSLFQ_12855 [Thermoanaerobaculia bacterium]